MANSTLLSVAQLDAWYTPSHPVLSDFSLNLSDHEVVGLIGLNGAGKTTFIKVLSGLLTSFTMSAAGTSLLANSVSGSNNSQQSFFRNPVFKKNRYVVFAEDHSFAYFTFYEYLSYVAASYKVPVPDVTSLIKGFHFGDFTHVLLKELSTGNRKKAYLITAFALHPKLLLLDEPVNGLDFQSTEFLYQLISEYKTYGTILFSSHILESICLTSDRVLVLEEGNISHTFTGKQIQTDKIREALRI